MKDNSLYKLKEFPISEKVSVKGYEITWKELNKILDIVYPDTKLNDKWFQKWVVTNWNKYDMDRTYIKLRQYKNQQIKKEIPLGYYDNINKRYIISDRSQKIIDIIEKYKEYQTTQNNISKN